MAFLSTASSEIEVNRTVDGAQSDPQILALSDNNYAVAWASTTGAQDIVAQRLAIDGSFLGFEYSVNPDSTGQQTQPSFYQRADGSFTAAWFSEVDNSDDYLLVELQADGQVTGESTTFIDSGFTSYFARNGAYGENDVGRVVVVSFEDDLRAYFQFFGERFISNSYIGPDFAFGDPEVAEDFIALPNGRYISGYSVVSGDDSELFGVVLNQFGESNGDIFSINGFSAGQQTDLDLELLEDGTVMAVWSSEGQDGSGFSVVAQRFTAAGEREGFEFLINQTTEMSQSEPSVSDAGNGTFVVTWSGETSSGQEIYARYFDYDGQPLSDEVMVSAGDGAANSDPFIMQVGAVADGLAAVAWTTSGTGATEEDIRARLVQFGTDDGDAPLSEAEAQTVALTYEAGLNRDGNIDLPGLNFWIDQREAGLSELALAQAFLDSAEFAAQFGDPDTLSDTELVEVLYQNVLNRAGEQGGIDFWVGALENGFGRDATLLAFAESPENRTGSAFVETLEEASPGAWDFVA